ncbi:selenide, water dikinase [Desulfosudis oleivorans Hxd3]|uniref:Selenide, water dikinase n=2 Tax=Desulfosudis TaxID=2904716 RepID=A9A0N5_DESOH|nr:selenide, water dikinase [Desulfosudis oleivorans Hxd3]
MTFPADENVLVGLARADDAGVYKLTDDLALVQTVDFFTPIVDDPYDFGRIAAANALSDVYAMGGVPKTAMNIVVFPDKTMDLAILRRVIEGGMDTLREANTALVGGHTITGKELVYGLSVTGTIAPGRVKTKKTLVPGDALVLTKPLGTGIVNTAIKAGLVSDDLIRAVTEQMATLNRAAAEVMADFTVHACTDVTGFGLLGHLAEMVCGSGASAHLFSEQIPVIAEAPAYAAMGLIPGGAYKNREFRAPMVQIQQSVNPALADILFDPQTSGGLLISVAGSQAKKMVTALHKAGVSHAAAIGTVTQGPDQIIVVK